jgi:hypothetical protein
MMGYNRAYLQHSMGEHGRQRRRRMVQAQSQAAIAVENSIWPHDIQQEEEETMEERLDKYNQEWAYHYVMYMYSHPSSHAAKQIMMMMDTKSGENEHHPPMSFTEMIT